MMFSLGRRRPRWSTPWIIIAIVGAVLLFTGLLVVNVAGQGYEPSQTFRSPTYNLTSPSFPAGFLRESLKNKSSCDGQPIGQNDAIHTNQSMFEYKVVDTQGMDIEYRDTPLTNCWVEEILVRISKNLEAALPPDFGFFPTAECLITCQDPPMKLWTDFTYTNKDPLRKAQASMFPTVDISNQPPSYWAQAVLIYWWDQISVNLTKANELNFNSTLQSVLLEAIYTNDTRTNIFTNSTITTSFALANSTRPTTFTKSAATTFTPAHLALLNDLQIFNASAEFLTSFYWAINVDLGQFSDQNIFTNSELLADATDIFHDNQFIADIFQNTPLSDGRIPGDGYRAYENKTAPPIAVPAIIETQYLCWKWVRKPFLLALIDITVPTLVLWLFICFAFYLLGRLIFVRRSDNRQVLPLSLINRRNTDASPGNVINESYPSFEAFNPTERDVFLMPRETVGTTGADTPPDQRSSLDETGSSIYPQFRRGVQDPFADQPGQSSSTTAVQTTSANPEVRTLASSEQSILETPVSQAPQFTGRPHSQSFEARALRDQEDDWEGDSQLAREVGAWVPRLEERRSYTDLKRMKVVK